MKIPMIAGCDGISSGAGSLLSNNQNGHVFNVVGQPFEMVDR